MSTSHAREPRAWTPPLPMQLAPHVTPGPRAPPVGGMKAVSRRAHEYRGRTRPSDTTTAGSRGHMVHRALQKVGREGGVRSQAVRARVDSLGRT